MRDELRLVLCFTVTRRGALADQNWQTIPTANWSSVAASVIAASSLGYVYSKGKDLYARNGHKGVDADRVNYIEVGTWYYFNKNMNVYTAYKFNLLDKDDAAITDAATDDQFAVGIVYQF